MTARSTSSLRRQEPSVYLRLSSIQWLAFGFIAVAFAALSTEPVLLLACLTTLVLGALLLWRVGEPPILFAAFVLQWLQISTSVFRASLEGVDLSALFLADGMIMATWLSLMGLLVLALAVRCTQSGRRPSAWNVLYEEVKQYSITKAFLAYCVSQVVFLALDAVAWSVSGVTQLLLALGNLRWIFVFIIAVIVIVQRRGYGLLMLVLAFEITRGFLSFYADFKEVFLVMLLALLTARPRINTSAVIGTVFLTSLLLIFAAAWSFVKSDYRNYLNQGTGLQAVFVSPTDRFIRISNLLWSEGLSHLPEGFDELSQRIEYTYYFGRVVEWVPDHMPHADGVLWGGAVLHVLTPRLLNPDKVLTPDVINTQTYTGLTLVDPDFINTEIPMGYMAESYVDFGVPLMFIPVFLLGILYGREYRYFMEKPRYLIFMYGAAAVVLRSAAQFEISAIKIIGGNITIFIVAYFILNRFAATFHSLLLEKGRERSDGRTRRTLPVAQNPSVRHIRHH